MALTPGTHLGPYEITAQIGAGGMGEVYRATDSHLKRSVAIKVLGASVAGDADRLARFQREAEVLAALNHPNIAAIYGLEKAAGVTALVMELVEGEDLSAHIARGPIPLAEALPIARQIAEALEAAHEQSIIHRDLKPANIKVRADGTVKVLDFGLAKAVDPPSSSSGEAMNSPTMTARATQMGMILGTAAYMAPEQARGKAVDRRADIWAFGVVLYEMLTGRRAFEGDDVSITLASVLMEDVKWDALPPDTPASVRRLLRRCLEKEPKRRLSAIGDARLELDDAGSTSPDDRVSSPAPPVRRSHERAAWLMAAVLAAACVGSAAIAIRHLGETPPAIDPVQFTMALPEEANLESSVPQFALSPDGRNQVFSAVSHGGRRLWLRPLNGLSSHEIPGTDGAQYPFWSADSRELAFFASGKLKKVKIGGGTPVTVCDATGGRGGTWNADGIILFGLATGPLQQVAASGGTPAPATGGPGAPPTHRWPFFLPDGRHFLFVNGVLPGQLMVGALKSQQTAVIGPTDSGAIYASGFLLFTRASSLMAQPYDPTRLVTTGNAVPVVDRIGVDGNGFASFSASTTGAMAWVRGLALANSRLTWVDRAGKSLSTIGEPSQYFNVAISPDGRRIATSATDRSTGDRDIYLIDLTRAVTSRFTFDPASDGLPLWSPDGSRIVFSSNRNGRWNIFEKASNLSGQDELLLKSETTNLVDDWSRDGRFLLYTDQAATTGSDLWILPRTGDRKPFPFLRTSFNEDHGAFSPDGRWIAYASSESKRDEVYVRPFPGPGGQHQISNAGGTEPQWRADGKELFFLGAARGVMAVPVDTTKDFKAGAPTQLFVAESGAFRHSYAVSNDGKQFLVPWLAKHSTPAPITVVLNWPAVLAK